MRAAFPYNGRIFKSLVCEKSKSFLFSNMVIGRAGAYNFVFRSAHNAEVITEGCGNS